MKLKTKKALIKRIKFSKNKFFHNSGGLNHLMLNKSKNQKDSLNKIKVFNTTYIKLIKKFCSSI